MWAAAVAGAAAIAGTLTRYEGWFLIPFVALFFLSAAKRNRILAVIVFGAIASLGPLAWLAHDRWYTSDWLSFYRGPYSAKAIQGSGHALRRMNRERVKRSGNKQSSTTVEGG